MLDGHLRKLENKIFFRRSLSILLVMAILVSVCLIIRFGLFDILIFGPLIFMAAWGLVVNKSITYELIGKFKQAEAIGQTADSMKRRRECH